LWTETEWCVYKRERRPMFTGCVGVYMTTDNKVRLSEYILKSRDERVSHINLQSPCIETNYRGAFRRLLLAVGVKDDVGDRTKAKIHVCHLCDYRKRGNYACGNPQHMYLGTPSENQMDKSEEARSAPGRKTARERTGCHAVEHTGKGGRLGGRITASRGGGFRNPKVKEKAERSMREIVCKPVVLTQISTGKKFVFPSITEAAKALSLGRDKIGRVCRGRRMSTGGYLAEYLCDS
jgi:hypothetical protein